MPLDAPALVRELRATFESGRTLPLEWRREQLRQLERLLVEREEELLDALAADLGKPRAEAYVTELGPVRGEAGLARRSLRRWVAKRRVDPGLALQPARAWVRPEPLGVALIIAPWNYPLNLALTPLIGAIAAGCCAVVKPSELAPATSAALARLLPDYLDARAIRVVEGAVDETTALLAERWNTIFYTGNGRVGRIVARAAAEHLTPTTLELGGKSPVFVDETGDLAAAARRIAWGKFTNAGQTCVAPDYVLATPGAARELERLLPEALRAFYGADALDSDRLGRIVNDAHFARLRRLLTGSGRIVTGGGADASRRRLEPTILADVRPEAPIMAGEIFGPILPIVEVPDADAAIRLIRERDKPLALYVFSRDRLTRRKFAKWTSSGALVFDVAIAHLGAPNLPFGGVGESGVGSYHGRASLLAFSHDKPIVDKPLWPDTLAFAYPPMSERALALMRRVLR